MDFEDDAIVVASRPHGEAGAIVEVLTRSHGRWAAHVPGGAGRRLRPILQPGSRVSFRYRARVAEQLGSAQLEGTGEGAAALFDDSLALAGLMAAAAVFSGALPEREPNPGAYFAMDAFLDSLSATDLWPAVLVRLEAGLLDALGFGLSLGQCAVTGSTEDLLWVSPRTGRAVSGVAGEPYRDRLFPLPPFMLSVQQGVRPGDIGAGLVLTGHFLTVCVFEALGKPLPPARARLVERLDAAGRL